MMRHESYRAFSALTVHSLLVTRFVHFLYLVKTTGCLNPLFLDLSVTLFNCMYS
jgi:hypothetical protein